MRLSLLLLLAPAFLAQMDPVRSADAQVCDGSDPKITASPGGAWTASVQERVCSTPSGGAAAAITVLVARQDAAGESGRVLAIAVPGSRDEWPRVAWRNDTELVIWVPNLAHVVEQSPAFRDVKVELRYCGDDPAARAAVAGYQEALKAWMRETTAWAQKRKSDPDAAGPRPVRPQEPRPPKGLCSETDLVP